MRILFLALLSVFLTFSCVTQRRCLQRFPPSTDTVKIVSTRDTIIYRDTIIFLEVESERVHDSILIPCPEVKNYIADTVRAETTLALARAWWKFPRIQLSLEQKDSVIILRAALKESRHWQSEYERIVKTPQPIKYVPTFYKISLWLWIGVVLAVGGFIAFRIWVKK
jgi:hypothetical protein